MQTIDIYDSEGNEYGTQRTGRTDQRIQDFFFAGLKLAVDITGEPEVICFFRARESDTSRSEQFYAVYQTGSKRNLFSNFKKDFERTIDQYGLTLVTDTDDTQFYHELDREMGAPPGDEMQRKVITAGAGRGQPMRVGVGTSRDAFSLAKSFLSDRNVRSVAIADQTTGSVFEDYTLSIEIGQYRGVEPLGDTQSYLDEVRDSIEDQLIADRIDAIQEEVRAIRTETSLSSTELKNRLKRQLSVLDPPAVERARGTSDDSRLPVSGQQLGAIVGVVVVVLAAVVGVGWQFGLLPFGFGDGGDGGDGGPDNPDAIEYVSINGQEITEGGDNLINLSANGTANLTVRYSARPITVSLNGTVINETSNDEDLNGTSNDGEFEFTAEIDAARFTNGSNNLTVEAGNTSITYQINVANTTGEPGTDGPDENTETNQPSLSVTNPSPDTVVRNTTFTVNGNSSGDNVTVEFYNRSTGEIVSNATQTVNVDANDSFSIVYRVPENVSEGAYDITVNTILDGEYNTTTITNVTVVNDTTANDAPNLRDTSPALSNVHLSSTVQSIIPVARVHS